MVARNAESVVEAMGSVVVAALQPAIRPMPDGDRMDTEFVEVTLVVAELVVAAGTPVVAVVVDGQRPSLA